MGTESIGLSDSSERILAETVTADRDYPPFHRSARDGFAVRAEDLPGQLKIIGEVRAGQNFDGTVHFREAVEIMTGAPLPQGADAVVMVEHCVRVVDAVLGDVVSIEKTALSGDNFSPRGCETKAGEIVLGPGHKLGYSEIALLASVGHGKVTVYRKPQVAIIATGDEIVQVEETPLNFQIRNSNAMSLAAQVRRAGGIPDILPIAGDNEESTRAQVKAGLAADLLLLSGGVSAGKYDIVEKVLAGFGAEFFFDRVLIQPGAPVVFGKVHGKFFFGLPGNPASTMVTFEIFARAAIERMQGELEPHLAILRAKLVKPFKQKPGLTRFLPALLTADGIAPVKSQGSGDVVSLARANAYLVTDPKREEWAAGEDIGVLLK